MTNKQLLQHEGYACMYKLHMSIAQSLKVGLIC